MASTSWANPLSSHLVCLVEDEEAERAHVERASAQVVQRAARRADDDLRAVLQRPGLGHQRSATVQLRHAQPMRCSQGLRYSGHLNGKFPCRHEHQRLHPPERRVAPLHDGRGEMRSSSPSRYAPALSRRVPPRGRGWTSPEWAWARICSSVAIAALVPALSAIPGNTDALAAASSASVRCAAGNSLARALDAAGRPARASLEAWGAVDGPTLARPETDCCGRTAVCTNGGVELGTGSGTWTCR